MDLLLVGSPFTSHTEERIGVVRVVMVKSPIIIVNKSIWLLLPGSHISNGQVQKKKKIPFWFTIAVNQLELKQFDNTTH